MKKTLYQSTLIACAVFGITGISHAQDFLASIQVKTSQISEQKTSASTTEFFVKQNQEIKNDIEKRTAEALDGERTQIAEEFENAVSSLNNLLERIRSRIAKMRSAGIDVSSSETLFETAETNIATASENLTGLENLLAEPTSTSTRETILASIKTQSDTTKSSIETAYGSIMNLINELKQESEDSATSTNQTATTTQA